MRQSQIKMIEVYNCKTCNLHVRETNYAARHMYESVLGFKYSILFIFSLFRLSDVDVKYYADGENGMLLTLDLDVVRKEYNLPPFKGLDKNESSNGESTNKTTNKKNRKGRK